MVGSDFSLYFRVFNFFTVSIINMSYSLFTFLLFVSESNTASKCFFVGGFGLLNVYPSYESAAIEIAN